MLDNRLNLDGEGIGIQIRIHYCNRDLCVLFNRQALQRGRYYDKSRIHEARKPREILSVAHVPVRDLHRFLPKKFKSNSVLKNTDAVVLENAFIVHGERGIKDKTSQNISINRYNIHSALVWNMVCWGAIKNVPEKRRGPELHLESWREWHHHPRQSPR
jgi:hypothetical protein